MGAPTIMSPLPPELAEVAKGQLGQLQALADELASVLRDKEEFYRRIDESAPAELRKVCEVNLRNAFHAFIEARDVDLECARKTARAQARLGIPLPAVLRAFRIAGTFSYEAIVERAIPPGTITPEQLLPVSNTIWRIIDAYSEAIATAYTEVTADSAHYDEKARSALVDGLLEGRFTRQAEFDEAARGLGLPPSGPFVVLVSDPGDPGPSTVLDPARWRAVWRSTPEAEVGVVVVARAVDLRGLRQSLDRLAAGVGMSPPVSGLNLLPAALRRAHIARRCLAAGEHGVVAFADRPLTTLVAGAGTLARELTRDILADLLTLPAAERDVLLKTLQVWFAEQGSAKDAAERLFVHPNTVRYRIRRIQELTKRDLTDPRAAAELYLAIETHRLSDVGS
ncbi:PucR family transcriptional regulator [Actinokineospora guangxiensis]|uniref:PucR family transcriptional regulator n=1 Tax=Actinokineospora guangxiensis TaxID=1490288 RepID=A0ABW0EN91_9PSEU